MALLAAFAASTTPTPSSTAYTTAACVAAKLALIATNTINAAGATCAIHTPARV